MFVVVFGGLQRNIGKLIEKDGRSVRFSSGDMLFHFQFLGRESWELRWNQGVLLYHSSGERRRSKFNVILRHMFGAWAASITWRGYTRMDTRSGGCQRSPVFENISKKLDLIADEVKVSVGTFWGNISKMGLKYRTICIILRRQLSNSECVFDITKTTANCQTFKLKPTDGHFVQQIA